VGGEERDEVHGLEDETHRGAAELGELAGGVARDVVSAHDGAAAGGGERPARPPPPATRTGPRPGASPGRGAPSRPRVEADDAGGPAFPVLAWHPRWCRDQSPTRRAVPPVPVHTRGRRRGDLAGAAEQVRRRPPTRMTASDRRGARVETRRSPASGRSADAGSGDAVEGACEPGPCSHSRRESPSGLLARVVADLGPGRPTSGWVPSSGRTPVRSRCLPACW